MRYPKANPPPVQQARSELGLQPTPTTITRITPIAPPGSRMEQRPAVVNQWGHMSLAGNDTDRNVVPLGESAQGGLSPIVCGLGGFLLFGLLSGR